MDYSKQYTQNDLPGNVFNAQNGDVKTYNGQQVKVGVNDNGTRTLSPYTGGTNGYSLGDIGGSAVDFAKTLNTGEDQAYNNYNSTVLGMAKPLDIYSNLENKAGIPGMVNTQNTLRGTVNNLEDSIRRIEPDVSSRAMNSFQTESQRRGTVAAESYLPTQQLGWITQSLGRIGDSITNAKQDIGQKVGYTLQGQQQELDPLKMRITQMADRSARLMSGFTSDQQTQLKLLMDKLDREQHLSDQEWQKAAALSAQNASYKQAMDTADKQNERIRSLGKYGGGYIDPNTGHYVSVSNSNVAPSGGGGGGSNIISDGSSSGGWY